MNPDSALDPGLELTAEGHDLELLRESLRLTPEERIERNAAWVRMILDLRAARETKS